MLKRILIVLSISVVVVLALEPVQAVHGILMTDSQVRQLDAADNSTSDLSSSQDGSGNNESDWEENCLTSLHQSWSGMSNILRYTDLLGKPRH